MSGLYDSAFKELIGLEGNYVNDPYDRGGETKYGISKRQYPDLDIKNLTLDQAKAIYKRDYWDKLSLNLVPHQIASELFEQAVNFGVYWAGYHLQRALNLLGENLATDGVIGPKTIDAANDYSDKRILFRVLNGLQFMRYVEIVSDNPSQQRFFKGWLKRVGA